MISFFKNVSRIKEWSETESSWAYVFGVSCCNLQIESAFGPRYDAERFGFDLVQEATKADTLIVAGPVNKYMEDELKRVYANIRSPKFVIAFGACASTGGVFSLNEDGLVANGIEKIIPVDLYVPGCAPRPESLIHALLELKKKRVPGRLQESSV